LDKGYREDKETEKVQKKRQGEEERKERERARRE
jgi:hypothetical protein